MPGWYPGQVAVGQKVEASVFGMARGFWSQPPVVTTPGTVLTGGTITNTTGFDCMVYMSATTGIGKIVVNGNGTVSTGATASASGAPIGIYLPVNQTIVPTYTGTLTWTWLAV